MGVRIEKRKHQSTFGILKRLSHASTLGKTSRCAARRGIKPSTVLQLKCYMRRIESRSADVSLLASRELGSGAVESGPGTFTKSTFHAQAISTIGVGMPTSEMGKVANRTGIRVPP
jgi:hypothetical protein